MVDTSVTVAMAEEELHQHHHLLQAAVDIHLQDMAAEEAGLQDTEVVEVDLRDTAAEADLHTEAVEADLQETAAEEDTAAEADLHTAAAEADLQVLIFTLYWVTIFSPTRRIDS